jgi:hypothetical protein
MSLCDSAVRHAKATGKQYTLADTLGLSLCVYPSGAKCWHFRYQWFNKTQRMSLGTYPEVTLSQARALRDESRALVAAWPTRGASSSNCIRPTRARSPGQPLSSSGSSNTGEWSHEEVPEVFA